MIDEDGTVLSDKEILKEALDHLAEASCALYEIDDPLVNALTFTVDSCLKLGTVIYNDDDILRASANWEEYEAELYEKHNRLKVIK